MHQGPSGDNHMHLSCDSARRPVVCPAHREAATEHVNKAVGCATVHADKPASPSWAMYAGRNPQVAASNIQHCTPGTGSGGLFTLLSMGKSAYHLQSSQKTMHPRSSLFGCPLHLALAFSGGRQSCHRGTADTRARPRIIAFTPAEALTA